MWVTQEGPGAMRNFPTAGAAARGGGCRGGGGPGVGVWEGASREGEPTIMEILDHWGEF